MLLVHDWSRVLLVHDWSRVLFVHDWSRVLFVQDWSRVDRGAGQKGGVCLGTTGSKWDWTPWRSSDPPRILRARPLL